MKFSRTQTTPPVVENAVPDQMAPIPFAYQEIKGLIGAKLESNIAKALLGYPVEEYLRTYKTVRLARWPTGEYLGKYAQADALAYQYSGNQALADQMAEIADAWIESLPEDGYHVVRGPHEQHARWKGAWEVWELKYVLVGLIAMYRISGNDRLLNTAKCIGDLVAKTFGFGEGQLDLMEVGALRLGTTSILEPMVDLYRFTGDSNYLDFCNYVMEAHERAPNGTRIITELLEGSGEVDQVGGPGVWQKGKAYEMMSSFIGVLRMYQLTGRKAYLDAMLAAWQDIVENRLFVTGTAANHEFFLHKHVLPAEPTDSVGEGCVTAHWLFFNRELFYITGDPKFIDEIETSVYNALFASQDPHLGLQSYFTPLDGSRSYEMFGVNTGGPPCCHSSVAREIARTPGEMWAKPVSGGVAILLYASGKFKDIIRTTGGNEVELSVSSETDFPKSGQVSLTLEPDRPAVFPLLLRVPKWCRIYQVSIGDESFTGKPGTFLEIKRSWKPGDTLKIMMDLPVILHRGGHAYPNHSAVKRGPQVLAVDSWLSGGDVNSARIDAREILNLSNAEVEKPVGWIGDQFYSSAGIILGDGKAAVLVPFTDAGQLGWTYNHDIRMYGAHTYRVWIQHLNSPKTLWRRIQNTDAGWSYSGEYTRVQDNNQAENTFTRIPVGQQMEISFHGRMVRVMGAFERSHADIFIDDEIYRDVKWYSLGRGGRRPFQSRLLKEGLHNLKIIAKDGPISLTYLEVLDIESGHG